MQARSRWLSWSATVRRARWRWCCPCCGSGAARSGPSNSPTCACPTIWRRSAVPQVFSELLKDERACAEIRRLVRPFDLLRMTKLPRRTASDREPPRRAPPRRDGDERLRDRSRRPVRAMACQRAGSLLSEGARQEISPAPEEGGIEFSCCDDSASDLRGDGRDEAISRPALSGPGRRRSAPAPRVLRLLFRRGGPRSRLLCPALCHEDGRQRDRRRARTVPSAAASSSS